MEPIQTGETRCCSHCETPCPADGRFCEVCGRALPPLWSGPHLFHAEDEAYLGVGMDLAEATLALKPRSGCALWFLGLLVAVSTVACIAAQTAYLLAGSSKPIPAEVLLVGWIEVLILLALWIWARWQPYAASIAALIVLATSAVVSVAARLEMRNGPASGVFHMQLVVNVVLVLLLVVVVRASRNPLGRSKLASSLARHPEPLVDSATEGLTVSTAARPKPVLSRVVMQAVGAVSMAALRALRSATAQPGSLARFGVILFRGGTLVLIVTQLHRASTVISGPFGRFSPTRYLFSSSSWLIAGLDTVTAVASVYVMVFGLAGLGGRPGGGREYWLRWLPRGAVMWSALAVLRIGAVIHSFVIGTFDVHHLSGAFFSLMAADLGKAVLCGLTSWLWRHGDDLDASLHESMRRRQGSDELLREDSGQHEGEPEDEDDQDRQPHQGDDRPEQ